MRCSLRLKLRRQDMFPTGELLVASIAVSDHGCVLLTRRHVILCLGSTVQMATEVSNLHAVLDPILSLLVWPAVEQQITSFRQDEAIGFDGFPSCIIVRLSRHGGLKAFERRLENVLHEFMHVGFHRFSRGWLLCLNRRIEPDGSDQDDTNDMNMLEQAAKQ